MKNAFRIRDFTTADERGCWRLFQDTVRRVNRRDYTSVQIDAWAETDLDPEPWFRRFDGNFAFVVEHMGSIVGFTDLTQDGYLDRLYVSADQQRKGVATMLMDEIDVVARKSGLLRIHTQASITAKPFFLFRGFHVVREQTILRRGVALDNSLMALNLDPLQQVQVH